MKTDYEKKWDWKREVADLAVRALFAVWVAVVWCYGLWVGAVEEHWAEGSFILVMILGSAYFVRDRT